MRERASIKHTQRGAATLIMTVLLMLLMSATSLTATRLGVMEGKTVAAEVRAREARQAAQAGLVYGMAWLQENPCGSACAPLTAPTLTTTTGYTYDPLITFSDNSGYTLVTSTAIANQESSIRATARQLVREMDLLSRRGRLAPPILIDGCLTNVAGGPSIYPRPGGEAVITLATSDAGDGSGCIDFRNAGGAWHVDIELCSETGEDVVCAPDETATATSVGDTASPDYLVGADLSSLPEPRAWNYMFDIPLDEAMAKATGAGQVYASDNLVPAGPAPADPFLVYTGSTSFNGSGSMVYGSPASPVVLIITDPSCPNLNGNVTVYGYIYYQGDPTSGHCGGWGGAKTVGTVILEGDASGFNANVAFLDQANIGGGSNEVVFFDGVTALSGSWKDW